MAVNETTRQYKKRNSAKRRPNQILPALVAVGGACGLASVPVSALELGEIRLDSALGQPLRASIAYALNPAEQLNQYCIYLRPGVPGSGIPAISNARITVTDSAILIAGMLPVREPMVSIQVAVDCPYTPHLRREYTLMINPAEPFAVAQAPVPAATNSNIANTVSGRETGVQTTSPTARTAPPILVPVPRPGSATATGIASAVSTRTTYEVMPGDTLSTIVARIEDRSIALWPAVEKIFAANPRAFIDNDPNRLMAGYELVIPDLNGSAPVSEPATTAAQSYSAPTTIPATETAPEVSEITSAETPFVAVTDSDAVSNTAVASATDSTDDLRPGDVVVPAVSPTSSIVIPDTAIDNDRATIAAPVVNTVADTSATETGATSGAWSWLIWLGGTGIALIFGLLLFGRAIKERFAPTPVSTQARTGGRRFDDSSDEVQLDYKTDSEFEDTINEQLFSLDANIDLDTGLLENDGQDVDHDFGFLENDESAGNPDVEDLREPVRGSDPGATSIMKPLHRVEDTSILLTEELAEEDDSDDTGNYDVSMSIDVLEQTIGDADDTATDLQAVRIEIDAGATTEVENSMTTSFAYEVLEQDYEDELTASQILKVEIEKASRELTERMDQDTQSDATSLLPSLDITAEITAELTANLPASLLAENDAVIPDQDKTADGSDITVDMKVAANKFKKKK